MTTQSQFQKRLKMLGRKHAAMANGYTTRVRGDGLIVVQPKRKSRGKFPLRQLLILAAAFFVFKAYLLSALDGADYEARLANMRTGGEFKQAGAWVMQADPLTRFLAGYMAPLTQ